MVENENEPGAVEGAPKLPKELAGLAGDWPNPLRVEF